MSRFEEVYARFHAEINSRSVANDLLKEHEYVEYMGAILAEAGEIGEPIRAPYQARGIKVDGYYYNEEYGQLNLIVALWKDEADESKARITNTEIEDTFRRCMGFFQKSRANLFEKIDIANEAHDLAGLIRDEADKILNVHMILITDGRAARRPAEIETIDGIEFKRTVWDIDRTLDFLETGEVEAIKVEFGEDGKIPCLYTGSSNGVYSTYLAFVPGELLANLYSLHGTRMLEMNVRVFLSARGNVNKGIRETILNDPAMFCAYNNGITVFARELDFTPLNDHEGLLRGATDFQIVNGGQTVASLYHAKRKQRADLSKITLPMKLISIVREEDVNVLVPKISEYSNTQNRVSLSDLAANDPPHPELHELSKRYLAPDRTGGSRTTHWFYEKARGSYEETRRLVAKTAAQEREFEALNPKSQRFDKGQFGKVWNTYLRKPYLVSLGAQKNFSEFNVWLKDQQLDLEPFFRQTVALLILWRDVEKIVRSKGFEGYRHNIVTYTLAWLFELTQSRIDLDRIWRGQETGEGIRMAADAMCEIVNEHIRETTRNVTEYCKREECWSKLLEREYKLSGDIDACLVHDGEAGASYDPRTKDERESIDFCMGIEARGWFDLSVWLKQHSFLTPKARSQCFTMGKFLSNGREPSKALAYSCKKAWEDAVMRGWVWSPESTGDGGTVKPSTNGAFPVD